MEYQIEIREIEPVRVAYIRYRGMAAEANKVFPKVFQAIRGRADGAPFFNYVSMDPGSGMGEIELCVPTAENPGGNGVEVKDMPRVRALCVTHTGPYGALKHAYDAIDRYAEESGLALVRPFREVYIKGPGMLFKGNPKNYITEIIFPVGEES